MSSSATQSSSLTPRINLPNALSALRIPLAGAYLLAFWQEEDRAIWMLVAFVVAVAAMVSDWADGFLARKMGTGSDFGKLFDPLADAFFFVTAFCAMGYFGVYPLWLAAPFVVRELCQHLYIRPSALRRGVALGAKKIGKIKTGVQSAVVLVICALHWQLAEFAWLDGSIVGILCALGAGLAGALSLASILPYLGTLHRLRKAENLG